LSSWNCPKTEGGRDVKSRTTLLQLLSDPPQQKTIAGPLSVLHPPKKLQTG
jgi:hypothetical protein